VHGFAVDDLDELVALRQLTNAPVLVLGYVQRSQLADAIALDATLGMYDLARLRALDELGARLGVRPRVHIKIDAYLGRQGVVPWEVEQFAAATAALKHVRITGAYSHFSNIEDTSDPTHAQRQADAFTQSVEVLRRHGLDVAPHISATSGLMVHDRQSERHAFARTGIGLYGMWPSEDLRTRFGSELELHPVARWVSHVAQVKQLPAGFPIGYGLTFVTSRPTKVAIVPQGYSDGYDRGLTNTGEVLVRGRRCHVLGRVAMNMFAIKVNDVPDVAVEDEVVLLGAQGNERITAEEIATKLGTINYEVTTRITPLLPRVLVD